MSGGGSSAPSSQNVTNTTIPEYARPYVESALGKTAALTDVNQNPYQPYQGQQVATFTPMQNQAFQNVGSQQLAPQIADASNIAYQTGQYGLGTQGTAAQLQNASLGYGAMAANVGNQYAQQATNPAAQQAYMNPYLQASLQPALQEVQRQYDITGAQQMGNATRSGAFGGSREALMAAENQRNKNLAMNQMIGQGYTTAFDKASQAQQFGANLGLQGLQGGQQGVQGAVGAGQYGLQGLGQAGASAGTLGQLGQTQFGQEQAANQAMMTAGGQQQALQQKGLDVARQEYTDQLNYPYKQLAFQSDMFRGVPLSQASQSVYQNTGNMVPQLLGAGIAAYGASAGRGAKEGGLMSYARGGAVQGYAMGGQPTVDPRAVSSLNPAERPNKLDQLSIPQLQAYARTVKDAVALAEIRAAIERKTAQPQGEMPTQTVAESVAGQSGNPEQPMMAAGGGIVALARGSEEAVRENLLREDYTRGMYDPLPEPKGTRGIAQRGAARQEATAESNRQAAATAAADLERPPVSEEERQAFIDFGRSTDGQYAEAERVRAAQAMAPNVDSQVQPGMIDRGTLADAEMGQGMVERQSQLERQAAAAQIATQESGLPKDRNLSGITVVPPTASGAPVGGGITTVPRTVVPVATGAPAGGGIIPAAPNVPAGGAPAGGINAITPRTTGAGGHGTTIGSTGAGVPVGVPGDPLSFTTYRANVEDMAKLDPEDKATLANMQARTEKRLRRAEKQEKNVMNDAFVAGGLAMMGGLNLSDGIRRAAEQGGKQYFSSQAEARKAIDKADEAQDSFDQYRTALKQGNKKLANEMYGTFYKSYTDYIGKIQAAGITAGASLENAKAQREATAAYRDMESKRHDTDRLERSREFDLRIKQNDQQFQDLMLQRKDVHVTNQYNQMNQNYANLTGKLSVESKNLQTQFENKLMMNGLGGDPSKFTPAQKKQYTALFDDFTAKKTEFIDPIYQQRDEVQQNLLSLQAKVLGKDFISGARTYNRETGLSK